MEMRSNSRKRTYSVGEQVMYEELRKRINYVSHMVGRQVLRVEMRSKLLNPKWAKAMADQGSGGAYEISQRMTTMIGWGGTTGFAEKWAFDQAAETYALDADMAAKLQKANPQACIRTHIDTYRQIYLARCRC